MAPVGAAMPPPNKKSGTQLGAALLAIFRSVPFLQQHLRKKTYMLEKAKFSG